MLRDAICRACGEPVEDHLDTDRIRGGWLCPDSCPDCLERWQWCDCDAGDAA